MIGMPELAIIVIVGAIIFFGKNSVEDWVKTAAEAKKVYDREMKKK